MGGFLRAQRLILLPFDKEMDTGPDLQNFEKALTVLNPATLIPKALDSTGLVDQVFVQQNHLTL